jgi:hypothetical protein
VTLVQEAGDGADHAVLRDLTARLVAGEFDRIASVPSLATSRYVAANLKQSRRG